MRSTKNPGRIAGFWYLLLSIIGPLRLIYIPSKLFVEGNATATVNNIAAHQERFPVSAAEYVAADLFDSPASRLQKFDFVLECYTSQVLPAAPREKAIEEIRRFSE